MKLREAEAFGVFDDHYGGVGNIDADFDDGGGHQNLDLVLCGSVCMTSSFSSLERRPCSRPNFSFRKNFLG